MWLTKLYLLAKRLPHISHKIESMGRGVSVALTFVDSVVGETVMAVDRFRVRMRRGDDLELVDSLPSSRFFLLFAGINSSEPENKIHEFVKNNRQ